MPQLQTESIRVTNIEITEDINGNVLLTNLSVRGLEKGTNVETTITALDSVTEAALLGEIIPIVKKITRFYASQN
jgi:hypothetical protein